jgi:hypothetical protein
LSLSDAFDIARLAKVVLDGKQPIGPILADARVALEAALRVVEGLQRIDAEIQAARQPVPPRPA